MASPNGLAVVYVHIQISVYRALLIFWKRCHLDQGEAAWRDLSHIVLSEMRRSLDFARDDKVGEHLIDKLKFAIFFCLCAKIGHPLFVHL